VGHFKIVLEAEVDSKVGKTLEDSFEKSSKKVGENLKKEIEKSIDKSITSARKFEKSFKIPSFGEINSKLTEFLGDTLKKTTSTVLAGTTKVKTADEKPSDLGGEIAAGTEKGAAVGGAKGAAAGGIMALVAKLSVVIGIITLVYDAIKSLAPIVAIFKLITAILQITLYPIAQFLLSIFKPILGILLKYVILPFYYNVMPILIALGKWIGGAVAGILTDPAGAIMGLWKFVIIGTILILEELWIGIKNTWNGIINFIINICNILWIGIKNTWNGIINFIINICNILWTGLGVIWEGIAASIINTLNGIVTYLSTSWSGITNAILGPIKKVWDWINSIQLPWWLGGGSGGGSGGGGGGNVSYPQPIGPGLPGSPGGDNSTESQMRKIEYGLTPGLAEGGIVTRPTVRLIGESGPEAVIPLNKLGTMGGTNIIFNINKIEKEVDINDIVSKIERILYVNMKRTGAR